MSYQWRVSLYVVTIQNGVQHSGEGDLILFGKIPVPTIELPLETISNVPWHIPVREAYLKVASLSE